jgi:hypothetical protein
LGALAPAPLKPLARYGAAYSANPGRCRVVRSHKLASRLVGKAPARHGTQGGRHERPEIGRKQGSYPQGSPRGGDRGRRAGGLARRQARRGPRQGQALGPRFGASQRVPDLHAGRPDREVRSGRLDLQVAVGLHLDRADDHPAPPVHRRPGDVREGRRSGDRPRGLSHRGAAARVPDAEFLLHGARAAEAPAAPRGDVRGRRTAADLQPHGGGLPAEAQGGHRRGAPPRDRAGRLRQRAAGGPHAGRLGRGPGRHRDPGRPHPLAVRIQEPPGRLPSGAGATRPRGRACDQARARA